MSPQNKKRNYNDLLIWSAALVTVIRYSAAFISSDVGKIEGTLSQLVTIGLGLSGMGMGLLDVIGGMTLFQGWRTAVPRSGNWSIKFKALTIFVFGLILNGVIIVVPFTVSRVLQTSMEAVLGSGLLLWTWATAVIVAPYMLIGGIAVSSNLVQTDLSSDTRTGEPFANRSPGSLPRSRTYASLTRDEKYYILNTPHNEEAARELQVTLRAIQKWKVQINEEVAQGRL